MGQLPFEPLVSTDPPSPLQTSFGRDRDIFEIVEAVRWAEDAAQRQADVLTLVHRQAVDALAERGLSARDIADLLVNISKSSVGRILQRPREEVAVTGDEALRNAVAAAWGERMSRLVDHILANPVPAGVLEKIRTKTTDPEALARIVGRPVEEVKAAMRAAERQKEQQT